ncbi:MAG: tetratricopeptide repeat protein [Pseudomonadota bacterium]
MSARRGHSSTMDSVGLPIPLWAVAAVLVALVCLVFGPAIGHGFTVYDDRAYLIDNAVVSKGLTWEGIRWAFTTRYHSHWHPLTWLSHMLDVELFGLSPGPHHAVNLALHVVNSVLVLLFFLRTGAGGARSALVAALFALHPMRVEAVVWVADRKDVLSSLFALLALLAYVWHARQPSWKRLAVVAVCTWLGVLAKISLVMLPMIFLIVDLWPLGRFSRQDAGDGHPVWRRLIAEKALLAFPMLPAAGLALFANIKGDLGTLGHIDFAHATIGLALDNLCFYLRGAVWPVHLATPYPQPRGVSAGTTALAILCLLTISSLVLWSRQRAVQAGWLWFLAWIAPVLTLFDIGSQLRADRYTYLAHVGLIVMVVWGLPALLPRTVLWTRMLKGTALAAVVMLAVACRYQVSFWRDDVTLFGHAVAVTQNNYKAYLNLAFVLGERGELRAAVAAYDEVLRIKDGDGLALTNRAKLYIAHGMLEHARDDVLVAVKGHPLDSSMRNLLAGVLTDLGDVEGARKAYLVATGLAPDNPDYHYNYATLLAASGDLPEAQSQLEAALLLDPDHVLARRSLEAVKVLRARQRESTPGSASDDPPAGQGQREIDVSPPR